MKIEELQEKLEGTHDFNDLNDCHSVIEMLLRDLDGCKTREERTLHDLKLLALAVRHNPSKAEELADAVISNNRNPGKLLDTLRRMATETTRAEELSDERLTQEVFQEVWSDLNVDGRPSAVLEELLMRFKKRTGQEG